MPFYNVSDSQFLSHVQTVTKLQELLETAADRRNIVGSWVCIHAATHGISEPPDVVSSNTLRKG